jgi:hypothetical protein
MNIGSAHRWSHGWRHSFLFHKIAFNVLKPQNSVKAENLAAVAMTIICSPLTFLLF